jgi:hypothetical protein
MLKFCETTLNNQDCSQQEFKNGLNLRGFSSVGPELFFFRCLITKLDGKYIKLKFYPAWKAILTSMYCMRDLHYSVHLTSSLFKWFLKFDSLHSMWSSQSPTMIYTRGRRRNVALKGNGTAKVKKLYEEYMNQIETKSMRLEKIV